MLRGAMIAALGLLIAAVGPAAANAGPASADPRRPRRPATMCSTSATPASWPGCSHMGVSLYAMRFDRLDAALDYDPGVTAAGKIRLTINADSPGRRR